MSAKSADMLPPGSVAWPICFAQYTDFGSFSGNWIAITATYWVLGIIRLLRVVSQTIWQCDDIWASFFCKISLLWHFRSYFRAGLFCAHSYIRLRSGTYIQASRMPNAIGVHVAMVRQIPRVSSPCEMNYTLLNPVTLHRRSLRALNEGSSAWGQIVEWS